MRLEAGHRLNRGQEYRFVVRVPIVGLEDTLLRAFVPTSGFPVALELDEDEQRRCTDLDQVEREILDFLALPDVKARLREVRDIAA